MFPRRMNPFIWDNHESKDDLKWRVLNIHKNNTFAKEKTSSVPSCPSHMNTTHSTGPVAPCRAVNHQLSTKNRLRALPNVTISTTQRVQTHALSFQSRRLTTMMWLTKHKGACWSDKEFHNRFGLGQLWARRDKYSGANRISGIQFVPLSSNCVPRNDTHCSSRRMANEMRTRNTDTETTMGGEDD